MTTKCKSWGRLIGEELLAFGHTGAQLTKEMVDSGVSVGAQLSSGRIIKSNLLLDTRAIQRNLIATGRGVPPAYRRAERALDRQLKKLR